MGFSSLQAARHRLRDKAEQRSARAASKRTSKFLQAKILEQMSGEKSRVPVPEVAEVRQKGEEDMFHLPPLPDGALEDDV